MPIQPIRDSEGNILLNPVVAFHVGHAALTYVLVLLEILFQPESDKSQESRSVDSASTEGTPRPVQIALTPTQALDLSRMLAETVQWLTQFDGPKQ
jgi:hypothetical protein